MATVTTTDVETFLGRSLTAGAETTRATALILMAEAELEGALSGYSLAAGTATDEQIVNDDPDVLWTAHYPVTDVDSVKVGAAVLTEGSYEWNADGRITLGQRAVLNEWEINPLSTMTGPYLVTYDYGLSPAARDVVGIVAYAVAEVIRGQASNVGGVRSETIGSYSVSYSDEGATLVINAESPALRHHKRNRRVSVPFLRFR